MHGGIKVYRGSAAAARNYLEADRSRADDYYLTEGTGIARRFAAGPDGRTVELASLSGDGYEAWVAGLDPDSGEPRGRLRTNANGVRFVEVIVNGPKSWSLAAELHPDLAAAYEAAQDRAAEQIIGWLGAHATTRVGPRGAQVAVPVERLEAVTVRHYTSRAGDPHRHLHLQVNARVFAAGKWRGLDTVAFRDSIAALNGIGHAAVMCDSDFRAALAAHGYTLAADGEITQLASFVGPFSKRATQIASLLDRYEADWRRAHPEVEPGPGLRRAWDARAWAEDRPDKVVPRDGAELRQRWLDELAALGYRDRDKPTQLALELPGHLDRNAAAAEIVARLGAARSAWNAADVRGQVEHLLARAGVVVDAAVRSEFAEDLTARALELCVPLHHEIAPPEHIRALTSQHVLGVEADLVARLATRGAEPATPNEPDRAFTLGGSSLDAGQTAAVAALTGDAALVVVEGAAGAGKTTTLAATRTELEKRGRRLVVVTPTLKAAHAATTEVGTRAGSAAWLAYQHGWRWDDTGTWSRLRLGEVDPVTGSVYQGPRDDARLRADDLLLVDEAGMLDQDTARALLTVADEIGSRVALLGDRQQLPAVGRGGVLELAHRWADPTARIDLEVVHRFTRETITAAGQRLRVPDHVYALLSVQMRRGDDPARLFDVLNDGGRVRVHPSEYDRHAAIADEIVAARRAGQSIAVVVDTREQADALNSATRDRLVAAGLVDDTGTATARAGQPVGVGDIVVTRRNDHDLDVANRDAWTITRVHRDGSLTVTGERGRRELPADYVRAQVELGYAGTAHAAQGGTAATGHLLLGEHTTAASAYVGLTRGREHNTVHVVAIDLDDAREQWLDAFARNRADRGPAEAGARAARQAVGYRRPRPLAQVLAELREAWSQQLTAHWQLERLQERLDRVRAEAAWQAHCRQILTPLEAARDSAHRALQQAEHAATGSAELLTARAEQHATQLARAWDAELATADQAAAIVAAGPGRLGIHRTRLRDAQQQLDIWTARWAPVLAEANLDPARVHARPSVWRSSLDQISDGLHAQARKLAAAEHPEHAARLRAAQQARERYDAASGDYHRASAELRRRSHLPVYDTGAAEQLPELTERLTAAHHRVHDLDQRVARLSSDPAITSHPDPERLLRDTETRWVTEQAAAAAYQRAALDRSRPATSIRHDPAPVQQIDHGPSMGR